MMKSARQQNLSTHTKMSLTTPLGNLEHNIFAPFLLILCFLKKKLCLLFMIFSSIFVKYNHWYSFNVLYFNPYINQFKALEKLCYQMEQNFIYVIPYILVCLEEICLTSKISIKMDIILKVGKKVISNIFILFPWFLGKTYV